MDFLMLLLPLDLLLSLKLLQQFLLQPLLLLPEIIVSGSQSKKKQAPCPAFILEQLVKQRLWLLQRGVDNFKRLWPA